ILLAKRIKNDTVFVVDRPLPAVFFRTESGREPVREWLQGLQKHERKIIGIDVTTVQYRWPLGMPLVRNLGSSIGSAAKKCVPQNQLRLKTNIEAAASGNSS